MTIGADTQTGLFKLVEDGDDQGFTIEIWIDLAVRQAFDAVTLPNVRGLFRFCGEP